MVDWMVKNSTAFKQSSAVLRDLLDALHSSVNSVIVVMSWPGCMCTTRPAQMYLPGFHHALAKRVIMRTRWMLDP